MILRLITENYASFKDAAEFNTFPSSKSHSHENHKIICGHSTALRLSAIYGANGAGKSNLLQALRLLKMMIEAESLREIDFFESPCFKFDSQYVDKPSGLAIEFFNQNNVFYYHVEFTPQEIVLEELFLSKKTKDVKLLVRDNVGIYLNPTHVGKGITSQFQEAMKRMVRPDMLLLSFLGKYYSKEAPLVGDAYLWFVDKLQLVLPNSIHGFVPHMIDTDSDFSALVNATLPELKTGIDKLAVRKEIVREEEVKSSGLMRLIKQAKEHPSEPQPSGGRNNNNAVNVIYEEGNVYLKTLMAVHKTIDGREVEMNSLLLNPQGASLKDLGRKCFAFTKLDAREIRRIKKSAFESAAKSKGKI